MTGQTPGADTLLRSLPDAVVFIDQDGVIVDASERVSAIGGWTPDALTGRSCFELFPDAVRPEVEDAFGSWVERGRSPFRRRALRLPVLAPDGGVVHAEIRVDRTAGGFVATIQDLADAGADLRNRLLEAVSSPVVDGQVLDEVVAHIGEDFAWDRVVLWIAEPTAPAIRVRAAWTSDPSSIDAFRATALSRTLEAGQGDAGTAWATDEVLVVDVASSGATGGGSAESGSGSEVFVPVRVGDRPIAVLELGSDEPVHPGLWMRSELETVSTAIGHLCERFRDRLQADALGGRLALALDAGRFGVWTLDVRSGAAEWSARMSELHALSPDRRRGGPDAVFAHVVDEDRLELGEAIERSRRGDEPVAVEYRVVPPAADGEVRWISIRLSRVRNNGGPPMLSGVAADVTARKQAEIAARRRTAAVEALQWVSRSIIAGRELHDIADAVAGSAAEVLGAEYGIVLYPRPGEVSDALAWAVRGAHADPDVPSPPRDIELPDGVFGARVVHHADATAHPAIAEFLRGLALPGIDAHRSALLVPVRGAGDRSLGLLVFTHRQPGYFTDDDAALAASIGSSTGVAIENAQQHEQQRLAVMAFQRQLLPADTLDTDRLDVCVRYHPGRDGLDVGGDWYDLIELPGDRYAFAVGDVCGHGVVSAAHMGQFRYSFRALVQASASPREAISVLNELALDELATTATMAYAELDPLTGDCDVWSCGHLPPVVVGSGGAVRFLDDRDRRGPMLGFLRSMDIAPIRTTLRPGEVLLLYTDGLVERRGEDIDGGLARLAGALAQPAVDLDDLCDGVYATLADVWPDADDTVVLAVRRRGEF